MTRFMTPPKTSTSAGENVEKVTQKVEHSTNALQDLKDELTHKKMNREDLEKLRGAIEGSDTLKEKNELMEVVQREIDARAAEEALEEKDEAPEIVEKKTPKPVETKKTEETFWNPTTW